MARKMSKAKSRKAKKYGNHGSAPDARVDHRRVNLALPLAPAIRSRFPDNFEPESYAEPSQKAISKIIYVLFQQYLPSTSTKTLLSQAEAYRLVQGSHAEAMSTVQSKTDARKISYWVEKDAAIFKFDPQAMKAVQDMPMATIAYHVWTLWALDTFVTKAARWTFIGHSFDVEQRKATRKPTMRQSIINRIVHDVYRPFVQSANRDIQSTGDIARLACHFFPTALKSLHALIPTIDGKYKRYAEQLTSWTQDSMSDRLQRLWEGSVFISEESRSRYLAPPIFSAVDHSVRYAPSSRDSLLHARRDQDNASDSKAKYDSSERSLSLSASPEQRSNRLIPRLSSTKAETKRERRRIKRRNIYLAIRPVIEPYIDEDLTEQKIGRLVRHCLETPTFLNTIPLQEAMASVTKLWKGRVFHDANVRRQLLRINEERSLDTLVDHQRLEDIRKSPTNHTYNNDLVTRTSTTTSLVSRDGKGDKQRQTFAMSAVRALQPSNTNESNNQETVGFSTDTGLFQRGLHDGTSSTDSFDIQGGFTRPMFPLTVPVNEPDSQLKPCRNEASMHYAHHRPAFHPPGDQMVIAHGDERFLDDLYRDHPEKALGPIQEPTMDIAAATIQQIAEEVVFGWLERWYPGVDWADSIHLNGLEGKGRHLIAVPNGALLIDNTTVSISELLRKCRSASKESEGRIEVDIIETVDNAIEICLVLKDDRRKALLEEAQDKIRASRSSVYIRAMDIQRRATEQLASFNQTVQDGLPTYFQSQNFRQKKEVLILDEALMAFKRVRDASSVELLAVLKKLLDSSHEPPPATVGQA